MNFRPPWSSARPTQSFKSLVDADEPRLTPDGIALATEELKFHHERVASGSDVVSTIGQFIFVIFGAIVVAALKVPEVIFVLPLFWSAWLLHAQQRDADAAKHALLARRLEEHLNRSVGDVPIVMWNSTLTSGAVGTPAPLATAANFIYWTVLFAGSWLAAVLVMFNRHHPVYGYWCIGVGSLISLAAIGTVKFNAEFERACLAQVEKYKVESRAWQPLSDPASSD